MLILDPYRREDETREAFLQRWWENCNARWTAISSKERNLFREHIFAHDYPETIQSMERLALKNGFTEAMVSFT